MPRNKQVCLGRLNEETGEIIPSKRKERIEKRAAAAPDVTVRTKVYGPYLLLMKLAKDTGLTTVLQKSFPAFYEEILTGV